MAASQYRKLNSELKALNGINSFDDAQFTWLSMFFEDQSRHAKNAFCVNFIGFVQQNKAIIGSYAM
jgi:hypothetical protein